MSDFVEITPYGWEIFMKKYYWVLFEITRHSWDDKGRCKPVENFKVQEITDMHPVLLQSGRNHEYGVQFKQEPPTGHTARERYELLNWKELSEVEYHELKGLV